MASSRKPENLCKLTLVELKDLLYRETEILKNSSLINKLPDKGESVRVICQKVKEEIKHREELQEIKKSVNHLVIGDKHVQKLCDIEKFPQKDRYKPFSTLNQVKVVKPDSKVFKIIEDCSHPQKPTKLINLAESIEILKQQDEKIKEEQMKARYLRMIEKTQQGKETDTSESEPEDFQDNFEFEECGE